ncbi:nucleotide sugar dehydrogenase [Neobacillus vireti]|uniref:UDP-glucose:GDP-mannose dehydrogenase n=1 Tax=Neobacillus vireti LMG 21834 TaxID=1131730 RepID=A0AB94IJD2_9BACI|nr:nucleotide sugar dehydrogenase [Neobacillus vireti]ETI67138.1 UDP-glucose:GDP-mannose dehydrogenase [Neobacillus vireti LMG 21834]KLT16561.1 UDP-N-acetyl-D-glucosamine dehydrogenase [Neobacillus vireti]
MNSDDSQWEKEKIAVIGLGYVGLPLSVLLAEKGFHVKGIDMDASKVTKLQCSKSYIGDIDDISLKKVVDSGQFQATTNFDELTDVTSIIICVPTPLTKHKTPDLSFIMSAGKEIQKRLQKGQLVILESSTFPGTTKEVLLPILEQSGLQVGLDFFLANSPERIDPGNEKYRVEDIPKVLGGVTKKCKEKALSLYRKVYREVVPVSSTEAAELTKLLENTFRFVNISFINEMAILCDHLKVDIWEVVGAASTKPYGFTPFYPGPGIGGHCIPVDPLYLQWKLQQFETSSEFITISDRTNERMIDYIVTRTEELLKPKHSLPSAKILIYGITYKKDVADTRDSPTLEVIKKFKQKGANVRYHDPYVPSIIIDGHLFTNTELTEQVLSEMDCVIILTDHSIIPLGKILHQAPLVFDTRNVTSGHHGTSVVVRLGEGAEL